MTGSLDWINRKDTRILRNKIKKNDTHLFFYFLSDFCQSKTPKS